MILTEKGINLMKEFEGLRLEAYQDSVGVWTIGYGNTFYENGLKVKEGDKISMERANELYQFIVDQFAYRVTKQLKNPDRVTPSQFSAMVSLAYNIGINAFTDSTLLKKVNKNPCDPSIKKEFLRWNRAGGKVLRGLKRRRAAEAELYLNG